MQTFDGIDVPAQVREKRARQHCHAILGTFAVPHQNLAAAKIKILDPQTRALEDAHARAVQQFAQQPMRAGQAPRRQATSARVSTTGKRAGALARTTSESHGRLMASTSRYRKRSALCAWFCLRSAHRRPARQLSGSSRRFFR